ncbi:hypothetical protein ACO2Q2_07955 [Dyella sp. KRB-257]|uniref:hypothetical protein n=1 Tax=Dyella sp. KRB-257 TaxID=3400915 RepID=UPI003C0C1F8E
MPPFSSYLPIQHKNGISALARRPLGMSYHTAWLLKRKLAQAMVERSSEQVLGGIVRMDDAYGTANATARTPPRRCRLATLDA